MTPGPAVILSALAPVISHVPLVEFIAPAPSVTHVTPNEQFSPLSQEKVDVVQIDFVHPAGSLTVVEPSVSHVVGSLLLLDEFATPVHQEQIASERFVHLPMPQNLEQIVEGVMEIPQERFPERTEKRLFDFPIPPTGEDAVELGIADVGRGSTTAVEVSAPPVDEQSLEEIEYATPVPHRKIC